MLDDRINLQYPLSYLRRQIGAVIQESYLFNGSIRENIALAAESLGLGSVILGMPGDAFKGDQKEKFKKALRFPEGWDFVIAIAIGVPKDTKEPHPVKEDKIVFVD